MVLAFAPRTLAHHSAAAFDTQKEAKVTGTVTEFAFRNPHVYLVLQVKKPDGSAARLEIEAGAASVLNPLGFTEGRRHRDHRRQPRTRQARRADAGEGSVQAGWGLLSALHWLAQRVRGE